MPVGLNLLETVEAHLLEAGLIPRDPSVLHRVIDFSQGDFSLRWQSEESGGHLVCLELTQQLAGRKGEKPMMVWRINLDDQEPTSRSGRMVLNSTLRPVGLAKAVTAACAELLATVRGPEADSAPAQEPSEAILETEPTTRPDSAD